MPRESMAARPMATRERCVAPQALPTVSRLYFTLVTIMNAFVVLSLFVSVVTVGMFDALEEAARSGGFSLVPWNPTGPPLDPEFRPPIDRTRCALLRLVGWPSDA